MSTSLDRCRDVAQQAVTAALHGDRDDAAMIVLDLDTRTPEGLLELALVLVDLVAHVHCRWAAALSMDDEQARDAWRELMADIETWRAMR